MVSELLEVGSLLKPPMPPVITINKIYNQYVNITVDQIKM